MVTGLKWCHKWSQIVIDGTYFMQFYLIWLADFGMKLKNIVGNKLVQPAKPIQTMVAIVTGPI